MVDERFLLIASHFWPHADSLSSLTVEFARALIDEVGSLTVLTRPTGSKGVAQFRMHGCEIIGVGDQLRRPRDRFLDSLRPWGRRGNWCQDVTRAVEAMQGEVRGVFVFAEVGEDRTLVRELRKSPLPAVFRLAAGLPKRAATGINPRHRFVSPVVTPSIESPPTDAPSANETTRTTTIPDAVPSSWNRASRTAVRQALTSAHPILRVKPRDIWLICNTPLTDRAGVAELVEQWTMATSGGRIHRLWLTGTGPAGFEIFRRIKRLGMEDRIVMPGQFDTPSDLLSACDGVIVPGPTSAMDWFTLSAFRFGIPVLIHESARACWEMGFERICEEEKVPSEEEKVQALDESADSIAVYTSDVASLTTTLARLERNRKILVREPFSAADGVGLHAIAGTDSSVREMALRYLGLLRTIGEENALTPSHSTQETQESGTDNCDDV